MGNLVNYVEQYGQQTFEQKSVGDIDILVLTELAYLPFEGLVPYTFEVAEAVNFSTVWQQIKKQRNEIMQQNPFMITEERLNLLELVAKSYRYQEVQLFGYVNDINVQLTKQFAAILFQWNKQERLVVFRGTDETLIGWKEDFMMTYLDRIPAQRSATRYFAKQAKSFAGEFIISGHSKGGNLALYAAAKQEESLQDHIQKVYCWDAPGAHRSVLETEGYRRIVPKAMRFIPQDALVGVMLESEVPYKIIHSGAQGMEQHSAMTWTIEQDHFVEMPELTRNSLLNDQTFKKWTASVSDEELELFFDCFFELLFEMGIGTLNDVTESFPHYLQKFISRANRMEANKRDVLIRVALLLVQLRYSVWRDSLNTSVTAPKITFPTVEEVLKNLHLLTPNIEVSYEASDENEEIRRYYQQRQEQKRKEKTQN